MPRALSGNRALLIWERLAGATGRLACRNSLKGAVGRSLRASLTVWSCCGNSVGPESIAVIYQIEYRRRRAMIADALGSPDMRSLSNNCLARTLGVSTQLVRWCRRQAEADGSIPPVTLRVGRDGQTYDVSVHVRYPEAGPRQDHQAGWGIRRW